MPSVFADFQIDDQLNLVGCSTGNRLGCSIQYFFT